jgi:DDE superfamily endonuclease
MATGTRYSPERDGTGERLRRASVSSRPHVNSSYTRVKPWCSSAAAGGAGDNADTYADDEVEAVVRVAAGRLVLLYLPTYSPWLNPIEMLGRQFRREVTHGKLFDSLDALLKVAHAFFDRYNERTERVLSIIGVHAA